MNKTITERVNTYPTKYKEGFTPSEIDELLKEYPNINMKKFNDSMMCHTGSIIDGEFVVYHCDVELALKCSVKKK
jgi:hypothetical protein